MIEWEMVGEIKEDEVEWANVGGRTIGHIDWNKKEMVFFGETYLVADKETFIIFYEEWLDKGELMVKPEKCGKCGDKGYVHKPFTHKVVFQSDTDTQPCPCTKNPLSMFNFIKNGE